MCWSGRSPHKPFGTMCPERRCQTWLEMCQEPLGDRRAINKSTESWGFPSLTLLWVGFTCRNGGKKQINVDDTAFICLLFAAFGVICTTKVSSEDTQQVVQSSNEIMLKSCIMV